MSDGLNPRERRARQIKVFTDLGDQQAKNALASTDLQAKLQHADKAAEYYDIALRNERKTV